MSNNRRRSILKSRPSLSAASFVGGGGGDETAPDLTEQIPGLFGKRVSFGQKQIKEFQIQHHLSSSTEESPGKSRNYDANRTFIAEFDMSMGEEVDANATYIVRGVNCQPQPDKNIHNKENENNATISSETDMDISMVVHEAHDGESDLKEKHTQTQDVINFAKRKALIPSSSSADTNTTFTFSTNTTTKPKTKIKMYCPPSAVFRNPTIADVPVRRSPRINNDRTQLYGIFGTTTTPNRKKRRLELKQNKEKEVIRESLTELNVSPGDADTETEEMLENQIIPMEGAFRDESTMSQLDTSVTSASMQLPGQLITHTQLPESLRDLKMSPELCNFIHYRSSYTGIKLINTVPLIRPEIEAMSVEDFEEFKKYYHDLLLPGYWSAIEITRRVIKQMETIKCTYLSDGG